MYFLGKSNNKHPLLTSKFKSSDFGPIVPSIFKKLEMFGNRPILNIFSSISDIKDYEKLKLIKECYKSLSIFSNAKLIANINSNDNC